MRDFLRWAFSSLRRWASDLVRERVLVAAAVEMLLGARLGVKMESRNIYGWACNLALIPGDVFVFLAGVSGPRVRSEDLGTLLGSIVRYSGAADLSSPSTFTVTSSSGVGAWAWRRDGEPLSQAERYLVLSAVTGSRSPHESELH